MHHRIQYYLPLLCSLLMLSPALAQTPTGATSLGDLAPWHQARSSSPNAFIRIGDLLYFSARTDASGYELWVSDGTPDGLRLVKDINPGLEGSDPKRFLELDGHLVFTAMENIGDLWVSDGTLEGTRQVTDGIRHPRLKVSELVVFEGYAYFSGGEEGDGSEVWRYSLGDDELVQVTNFAPGLEEASPGDFKRVAGRLLFNTEIGVHVIDAGGTKAERFVPPGGEKLILEPYRPVVKFGNYFYFSAFSSSTGRELWRTDGTAEGTALVVDLRVGSDSSSPTTMVEYRNSLYFVAESLNFGKQLYVTDGTRAGTELVRDQLSGIELSKRRSSEPWPQDIRATNVVDDVLYFIGRSSAGNYIQWRSDGTAAGSEALRLPNGFNTYLQLSSPFKVRDHTLMLGYTKETGFEFWRIVDGKSVAPIDEFQPGPIGSVSRMWIEGDSVFFTGSTPETGNELWEFQDDVNAPRLIANVMPDESFDTSSLQMADTADGVLFLGPGDNPNDKGVWRTDGTPDNTVRLRAFESGVDADGYSEGIWLSGLVSLNSRSVFAVSSSNTSLHGEWVVNDSEVTKIGDHPMYNPVQLGDLALSSDDGDLWRTDGEKGSVMNIAAINDGYYYFPGYFGASASDSNVWFFSGNQQQGSAVWKSDGTVEGTVLAADVTKQDERVDYVPLGTRGDDFYYVTNNNAVTLWRTGDSGTTLLARLTNRWDDRDFLMPGRAQLGDTLLLSVQKPNYPGGRDLWVTDGTINGTQRLGNIAPGRHWANSKMVVLDNTAYFEGSDEVNGWALWRSDGTKAGTGMAFDLEPGVDLSRLRSLTVHNGAIYFVSRTSTTGREIWKFDGVRAVQVTELMPGSLSADPRSLRSIGGRLYFQAYVPGQGRELMVLDE